MICYCYAIDGAAVERVGVVYLVSTAAQYFPKYEVWFMEGSHS